MLARSSATCAATLATVAGSRFAKCATPRSALPVSSRGSPATFATAGGTAFAGNAQAARSGSEEKALRRNPGRLFLFGADGYRLGAAAAAASLTDPLQGIAKHGHHSAHARLSA